MSIDATNAVISTKAGDVNVLLVHGAIYVTFDEAAVAAGLQPNDAVIAFGRYFDGTLHADRVRYDTTPFRISNIREFDGRIAGFTSSTVTVQIRKNVAITFNTNANTRFWDNGVRVTSPSYMLNEHIRVWASEYSNQSWLAAVVRLHHK